MASNLFRNANTNQRGRQTKAPVGGDIMAGFVIPEASIASIGVEFIGTALFTLVAFAAVSMPAPTLLGTAISIALAYAIVATFIGAETNPFFTLLMIIIQGHAKYGGVIAIVLRIIGQILGAIVGGALSHFMLQYPIVNANPIIDTPAYTVIACFFIETVFSAIFFYLAGIRSPMSGIFAGLWLFISFILIGGITGAVMNPLRAAIPQVVSGLNEGWAIFYLSQLLAVAIAWIPLRINSSLSASNSPFGKNYEITE